MRDERLAPKGWPAKLRHRRSKKVSRWHDDWVRRTEPSTEYRPDGRRDGTDYPLHAVDVDAPLSAQADFDRRVREIDGRDPDTGRHLPEPDIAERWRGAVLASVIGDALGHAVNTGATHTVKWQPGRKLPDEHSLYEYTFRGTAEPSAVTQLLAFTLEGIIRGGVAHRIPGGDNDPKSVVQHAYQRWLHTQPTPDGQRRSWKHCGPYARPEPDGWLVGVDSLRRDGAPHPDTVAALENFARTGEHSRLRAMRAHARGSEVVPRAAMAAVCADDPAEVFAAAVHIAVLTHSSPDDCLAAGTLAVILHQQIRDQPFHDCLTTARAHLERWPRNARMLRKIELALIMNQDYWVPTTPENIRKPFGDGGRDGTEALGLGLYCAMASDYVREALQLAMNYSAHRPVAGAITGMLIGAECGVRAIPADLRAAVPLAEVVDTLAQDALTEYSPNPPANQAWLHRYPAS
ncbi:ADP-ribosylglycohydrolase family protein [Saccharopolyspora sp. NPDC050642]|uniref:ADP-ribosylglycohydrolase family protein n=1 Tax=Saccharopolyspora sp. NPDC050642 TaxID=3157099 RepID=UPI0033E4E5C4